MTPFTILCVVVNIFIFFKFFVTNPGLPGWPTVLFAHNPKGGVLEAHLPTRVGILLTVWLLLTVCHEYGGVVGYDMLALGLSYSRGIKLIHISISLYNLTNLLLLLIMFWSLSTEHLVTKVCSRVFPRQVKSWSYLNAGWSYLFWLHRPPKHRRVERQHNPPLTH